LAGNERRKAERAAASRLYPSITHPSWLILRARRKIFGKWLAGAAARGALRVLDVGGKEQPYRPLIAGPVAQYLSVDIQHAGLVDCVADAAHLPFEDGSFDLVICAQVLEYPPNPYRVISEIHRVMKPDAVLLLSVPALFPQEHDGDRWRFLPGAISDLTQDFRSVEIVPELGSAASLLRTIAVWLWRISWFKPIAMVSLIPPINLMGFLMESTGQRNTAFCANYSVRAVK